MARDQPNRKAALTVKISICWTFQDLGWFLSIEVLDLHPLRGHIVRLLIEPSEVHFWKDTGCHDLLGGCAPKRWNLQDSLYSMFSLIWMRTAGTVATCQTSRVL